jgi:SAM-dependent methyltransferase
MIDHDDPVLHEDRTRADSFGVDADQYDRARPGYPSAMIDDLVADDPRDVLDVGCGTGIAGRLLVARGCRVLGVEPDSRMAVVARRFHMEVEAARFEHWQPKGRSFALLVSGQAWHWVDPHKGAAKAGEVVVPGGRVGLFWNCGRHEPDMQVAFDAAYRRVGCEVDTHSVVLGHMGDDRFELATEGLQSSARFGPVERRSYGWEKTYSRSEWLDQLPTHSDHRALPPSRLTRLLDEVGQAIDGNGGAFTMHYDCVLLTAARRDGADG